MRSPAYVIMSQEHDVIPNHSYHSIWYRNNKVINLSSPPLKKKTYKTHKTTKQTKPFPYAK